MKAIDLFGGFGGFTEGATLAGVRVVYAANHWPTAVAVHTLNHPDTRHECQDLRQADWSTLPRFDILLASPACQGHARAAQPARAASEEIRKRHDAMRATAWAVIDCADVTRPRSIVVENVVDFARRWELFPVWRLALERLGYVVVEHIELAADHGVPQLRERLFVTATRRPLAPRKNKPSGEGSGEIESTSGHPPFGPCVDWDAGKWRPITSASRNAQARMLRAKANHGARCLSQHTTSHPGVPLHEPIRTITTKDQWVVVDGDRYRPLTLREYARAMGFRDSFAWPSDLPRAEVVRGLGNAVPPPMAASMVRAVAEAA